MIHKTHTCLKVSYFFLIFYKLHKFIHSSTENSLTLRDRFTCREIKGHHDLKGDRVHDTVSPFVGEVYFDLFQDRCVIRDLPCCVVIGEVGLTERIADDLDGPQNVTRNNVVIIF